MPANRSARVAEEIKHIVSELLQKEIHDPRVPALVSVTDVQVNRDLSLATIFLSTLGGQEEKDNLMAVMEQAKGFFRTRLAQEMQLRVAPEIRFRLDESIEDALRISNLIHEVLDEDARRDAEREKRENG